MIAAAGAVADLSEEDRLRREAWMLKTHIIAVVVRGCDVVRPGP
jgi:hypothetical protein